jgi:hypothetical protein
MALEKNEKISHSRDLGGGSVKSKSAISHTALKTPTQLSLIPLLRALLAAVFKSIAIAGSLSVRRHKAAYRVSEPNGVLNIQTKHVDQVVCFSLTAAIPVNIVKFQDC